MPSIRSAAALFVPLLALSLAADCKTIQKDVVVIGGGGSGAYTAARLNQHGVKVALIEKEGRLGGHTNTYKDPKTGATTDYGVVVWANISVVTDFWKHYDEHLVNVGPSISTGATVADFRTGTVYPKSLSNIDTKQAAKDLTAYVAQLSRYPGLITGWDIPYPVPEDLLMDFGSFVTKYNLGLTANFANLLGQGQGNYLAQPAIYGLKAFDLQQVLGLENGFLVSATGNTQELYNKVAAELGANVYLNTHVDKIVRSKSGVKVSVTTKSGPLIIEAKKLVVTVPPKLENIGFLDLDETEHNLYARFNNSYYYNAVVTNTGLPNDVTIMNVDITAPHGIPALPGVYAIRNVKAIPGTFEAWFGSADKEFTIPEVKEQIIETVARLRKGLKLPNPKKPTEVVECNSHNPFSLHVAPDDIKAGFYKKWTELQGHRNTWWNGHSLIKPASYPIWNYTEVVLLPQLLGKK